MTGAMVTSYLLKTYLTDLSEAERENILRFFSDHPRSCNWDWGFDVDVYDAVSNKIHPLAPCLDDTLEDLRLSIATSRNDIFYQAKRDFMIKHDIGHSTLYFKKASRQEIPLDLTCFDS